MKVKILENGGEFVDGEIVDYEQLLFDLATIPLDYEFSTLIKIGDVSKLVPLKRIHAPSLEPLADPILMDSIQVNLHFLTERGGNASVPLKECRTALRFALFFKDADKLAYPNHEPELFTTIISLETCGPNFDVKLADHDIVNGEYRAKVVRGSDCYELTNWEIATEQCWKSTDNPGFVNYSDLIEQIHHWVNKFKGSA